MEEEAQGIDVKTMEEVQRRYREQVAEAAPLQFQKIEGNSGNVVNVAGEVLDVFGYPGCSFIVETAGDFFQMVDLKSKSKGAKWWRAKLRSSRGLLNGCDFWQRQERDAARQSVEECAGNRRAEQFGRFVDMVNVVREVGQVEDMNDARRKILPEWAKVLKDYGAHYVKPMAAHLVQKARQKKAQRVEEQKETRGTSSTGQDITTTRTNEAEQQQQEGQAVGSYVIMRAIAGNGKTVTMAQDIAGTVAKLVREKEEQQPDGGRISTNTKRTKEAGEGFGVSVVLAVVPMNNVRRVLVSWLLKKLDGRSSVVLEVDAERKQKKNRKGEEWAEAQACSSHEHPAPPSVKKQTSRKEQQSAGEGSDREASNVSTSSEGFGQEKGEELQPMNIEEIAETRLAEILAAIRRQVDAEAVPYFETCPTCERIEMVRSKVGQLFDGFKSVARVVVAVGTPQALFRALGEVRPRARFVFRDEAHHHGRSFDCFTFTLVDDPERVKVQDYGDPDYQLKAVKEDGLCHVMANALRTKQSGTLLNRREREELARSVWATGYAMTSRRFCVEYAGDLRRNGSRWAAPLENIKAHESSPPLQEWRKVITKAERWSGLVVVWWSSSKDGARSEQWANLRKGRGGLSRECPEEAQACAKLVQFLAQVVSPSRIKVLTFYSLQAYRLTTALGGASDMGKNLAETVGTIRQAEGSAWDGVIYLPTYYRTEGQGADSRTTWTAMTRARYLGIVLADKKKAKSLAVGSFLRNIVEDKDARHITLQKLTQGVPGNAPEWMTSKEFATFWGNL